MIGDVHGCHDQLIELLIALGYSDTAGASRHPNRQAIFVGDLIDRGPQQVEFLWQIGPGSDDHHETVKWFATLPLWLDLGDLRVVHACWDSQAMAGLGKAYLESEDFHEASEPDSAPHIWVENLCKGPEVQLPHGHEFIDKDGHRRDRARFRWWDAGGKTYDVACEVPNDVTLPNLTI